MKQRQQEGMKEGRGKKNEGSNQNGIVARGPSVSRSFLHVNALPDIYRSQAKTPLKLWDCENDQKFA